MHVLEQKVHVVNDGEAVTAVWDGEEYELGSEPVEVARGVAHHWIDVHGEQLRVEEIRAVEVEPRDPANPLEDNNRGEAFQTLKPKGKKKAEEQKGDA